MKLFGTPPSHFTRKVRLVLQELQIPYEFVILDKILETGSEKFADNPLHQYPVLEHNGERIIESDLICQYLIQNFGAKNPKLTFIPAGAKYWQDAKRLAIINGAMASGVKLIRGQRSNIPNLMTYTLFQQERASLDAALEWLENDCPKESFHPALTTMLDISLFCLYEWARFREMTHAPLTRIHSFSEKYRAKYSDSHPSVGAKK